MHVWHTETCVPTVLLLAQLKYVRYGRIYNVPEGAKAKCARSDPVMV